MKIFSKYCSIFILFSQIPHCRRYSSSTLKWATGAMSQEYYFENPYPDYTPENAKDVIEGQKIHPQHKLVTDLKAKWKAAFKKLQYLEYTDYSVYTGASGVALLKMRKSPTNLTKLEQASNLLSLHKLKKRRHTFLCGDTGPLAIGAVISHKLGKEKDTKQCIEDIFNMQSEVFDISSDLPNEYLYGRAGYLFSVLYVNKHVSPPPFDENFIRKIIETIFICGKNEAKAGKFKCPLMYQWHDSYYLGAAHGVSGIMYLLLQAKEYLTELELSTLVRPTVDYLTTLRFSSGNYPSSLGSDNDKYVQWCHGSPGFVFMLTQAYKVFGDPKYLQLADEAGEVVWKRGLLKKGYSICHGVSGNAYCFLELFQTTKEDKHLYRAIKFAEWCMDYTKDHEGHSPDRPLSLYEGISGPMYLLLDIQEPMEAKFPGFTL